MDLAETAETAVKLVGTAVLAGLICSAGAGTGGVLLLCAVLAGADAGAALAVEPGRVEHVMPAGDSSRVLALAANRERNAVAMLNAGSDKDGAGEQLRLTAIDAGGKLFKSAKSLQVGDGSAEVTAMLLSKTGALMLAGAVDGKGFVAELSKQARWPGSKPTGRWSWCWTWRKPTTAWWRWAG